MKLRLFGAFLMILSLSACDLLGIPDPAKEAERKDAEGKAIGGACRYAGRALEDCFTLNPTAQKASVFAGWKDMNDYMTQNKIEIVKPELAPSTNAATKKSAKVDESSPDDDTASDSAPTTKTSRTRAKPVPKTGTANPH